MKDWHMQNDPFCILIGPLAASDEMGGQTP